MKTGRKKKLRKIRGKARPTRSRRKSLLLKNKQTGGVMDALEIAENEFVAYCGEEESLKNLKDLEIMFADWNGTLSADCNDKYGMTPMTTCCSYGRPKILKFLISVGADINKPDDSGNYPLCMVQQPGPSACNNLDTSNPLHETCLSILLENADVNVNVMDHWGFTSLMTAVLRELPRNVLQLLNHGADVNIKSKTKNGATALMLSTGGNLGRWRIIQPDFGVMLPSKLTGDYFFDGAECVNLLLQYPNTDVNVTDNNMRTALWYACQNGRMRIAELLVEGDADIDVQDIFGQTAADVAEEKGFDDLARYLKRMSLRNRRGPLAKVRSSIKDVDSAAPEMKVLQNDDLARLIRAYLG
jgi:ankyrin repeat protein